MNHTRIYNQQGFVILFTILIAAIILMIGFGIFSIATRETVLSGTAREAQSAFYAADAGVECALLAQRQNLLINNGSPICGLATVDVDGDGTLSTPFEFDVLVSSANACAHVIVFDQNAGSERRVISQGYNICDPGTVKPIRSNPILVERVLDTVYQIAASPSVAPAGSPSAEPGKTGIQSNGATPGSLGTPATQTPDANILPNKPGSQ